MKTSILTSALALSAQLAFGQISIADFYPGNSRPAVGVNPKDLDFKPGGLNRTWDFSGISRSSEVSRISFVDPVGPVFSDLPDAVLVLKTKKGSEESFDVFQPVANGLGKAASISQTAAETTKTYYTNLKLSYPESLIFGFVQGDDYVSHQTIEGISGSQKRISTIGETMVSVDGTGTILLMGQTMENVVRLSRMDFHLDSTFSVSAVGQPEVLSVSETRSRIYEWYANDFSGIPMVMSVREDSLLTAGIWEVSLTGFFTLDAEQQITGVGKVLSDLQPYPTRVQSILTIPVHPGYQGAFSVNLTDALGRLNRTYSIAKEDVSENKFTLSLSDLPAGTFWVRVNSGPGGSLKSFQITKL